jgi:hypothetical protein
LDSNDLWGSFCPSHFEGRRVAEGGEGSTSFLGKGGDRRQERKKERQHKTSHTWERGGKKKTKKRKKKKKKKK